MGTKRQKPASEVTIKIGDLFEGLPDDVHKAAEFFSRIMRDMPPADKLDKEDCEGLRNFMFRVHMFMWARLLNEALHSVPRKGGARKAGGGPKGPRLPEGVTFMDLLPHLVEARQAKAEAESFNGWVRSHRWPGNMQVTPSTARTWLRQYPHWIDWYEREAAPLETSASG